MKRKYLSMGLLLLAFIYMFVAAIKEDVPVYVCALWMLGVSIYIKE